MGQALLLHHLRLEILSAQLHHVLLLLHLFERLVLVANSHHGAPSLLPHHLAFHVLSELGHLSKYRLDLNSIQIFINYYMTIKTHN